MQLPAVQADTLRTQLKAVFGMWQSCAVVLGLSLWVSPYCACRVRHYGKCLAVPAANMQLGGRRMQAHIIMMHARAASDGVLVCSHLVYAACTASVHGWQGG